MEWDSDCPVCGWEMDSGMTTDDGEEMEPPNYFKASDYRRFWEMSGKDRATMRKWWEWVAHETNRSSEYWQNLDDSRRTEIYEEILGRLEEHIKEEDGRK